MQEKELNKFELYECEISKKSKKCPLKLIDIEEEKQNKILDNFYKVFGVEGQKEIIEKYKQLYSNIKYRCVWINKIIRYLKNLFKG